MINRFTFIKGLVNKADETPETLYIMADEKWIHLQQETDRWRQKMREAGTSEEDIKEMEKEIHFSSMTKLAVIFTGREELKKKDGTSLKRKRFVLTGRHYFACPHDSANFWQACHDYLEERYDLSKVKQIYILGDGASWIKSGVQEMKTADTKCAYALDRYHLSQSVHKITKDKDLRKKIKDYAVHGLRSEFNKIINSIIESEPERKEKIEDCRKYLLSNMNGAVIMHEQVKIGCAMEQAICHVYASSFTSVPKAYGKNHLHNYVDARIHQQNNENMKELYINALQLLVTEQFKNSSGSGTHNMSSGVDLNRSILDFGSVFDSSKTDTTYHLNLNRNNRDECTKF
jgi:hypothetical protein